MAEASRDGGAVGNASRRFILGDGAFETAVLLGYVFLATVISGAASSGAGLAILVSGLLMLLTLGFIRWRTEEVKAGMRTGWELLEERARRPRPRALALPEERSATAPARSDPPPNSGAAGTAGDAEAPPAAVHGVGTSAPAGTPGNEKASAP